MTIKALSRAEVDVTDAEAVARAIGETPDIDLVFNATAYAAVDKAEAEAAAKLEEARVKRYEAETERLKVVFPVLDPATQDAIRAATAQQVMTPADLDAEAPPMNPDALAPPDMGGMPAPMQ